MKRSALARRTPLRRGGPLRRLTPLRQVSAKRRAESPARRAVVRSVLARDRGCVARLLMPHVECRGQLDVHEVIPRSAWPGGHLVEDNCVTACRAHHRYIDDHPAEAHALGLHGYSYERRSA